MKRGLLLLGAVVAGWTMLGVPAHATYGARVTADEPQYLLTAVSLGQDGDLDISDELAAEAYRPFHRVDIDPQTFPLDEAGRQVSPHDPLLPAILAGPVRFGGWPAAKVTLALLAAALAMTTAWTAVVRFGVRRRVALLTVGAFACSAPLATYATQVYPETPAALATMVAVAASTGKLDRRGVVLLVVAVVCLPWLSVKYAPVAASLALVGLWRLRGRFGAQVLGVAALVLAGVAYLVVHRAVYGGWTSYATGDHFAATGELTVIGSDPDYLGRSRRLVGLLVDRDFGLGAWMIGWLALPFAVGALLRRRPPHWAALAAPLAAGWLTATFVALTMHGWWWPGRQLVVVLPVAVIVVALAVDRTPALVPFLVVAAVLGAGTWLWTTVEAVARVHVLVVDFDQTSNPWIRVWTAWLPDGRHLAAAAHLLTVVWTVGVGALVVGGWRSEAIRTEDCQDATLLSKVRLTHRARRATHRPASRGPE